MQADTSAITFPYPGDWVHPDGWIADIGKLHNCHIVLITSPTGTQGKETIMPTDTKSSYSIAKDKLMELGFTFRMF